MSLSENCSGRSARRSSPGRARPRPPVRRTPGPAPFLAAFLRAPAARSGWAGKEGRKGLGALRTDGAAVNPTPAEEEVEPPLERPGGGTVPAPVGGSRKPGPGCCSVDPRLALAPVAARGLLPAQALSPPPPRDPSIALLPGLQGGVQQYIHLCVVPPGSFCSGWPKVTTTRPWEPHSCITRT